MTNETELTGADFPWVSTTEVATITFGIPDVPYSQVRTPLSDEGIIQAVHAAVKFRDAFLDAFPVMQAAPPPAASGEGRQGSAPPPAQRRQGNQPGAVAYCPMHNMAPVLMSVPKYQNPEGDKCYHEFPQPVQDPQTGKWVKSHTMFWRQTVDSNGNPNGPHNLPHAGIAEQHRRVDAAASQWPDRDAPFNDEIPF